MMGSKKSKAAAIKHKADWHRAILEGLVLKLHHGQTLKEYTTKDKTDAAYDDCKKSGVPCERVHGVHA
jgi:hypothetical protein